MSNSHKGPFKNKPFVVPTSLEEARLRLNEVKMDATNIDTQFERFKRCSTQRQAELGEWRSKAKCAKKYIELEISRLKAWVRNATKTERVEPAGAKAERIARAEESNAIKRQKRAELAKITDPKDPVCLLWAAYNLLKTLQESGRVELDPSEESVVGVSGAFLYAHLEDEMVMA